METHLMRIDDLNGLDTLFQIRGARAFVALETELHVLCCERIAIMKSHTLAQLKLIDQTVGTLAPLGRQRRSHRALRHGFD
jgi:hypothetical protein